MGKFLEALKKASKEDGSGQSDDSEQIRPLESANDEPEKIITPPRSSMEPKQNNYAPRVKTVPGSEGAATVEVPLPGLHPAPSMPDDSDDAPDNQNPPQPVMPMDPVHPVPEHDNATIVMVKASKTDGNKPANRSIEPTATSDRPTAQLEPATTPSRRNLQISYSQTKVQAVDPEKLKNNKIFSIFDDIETTDQIKILRTQVLEKLKAIGGNSILVTSSNPYEGKTFTSINLGVSIAKEFSRTVLIIDADLRKPTKRHTAFSTEFFTLDVEFGLTDYLKGEVEIPDILINPGIDKLTLIPGGNPVDNAPELLNSDRMKEMMSEIKSRYASDRLVIVDGPAMLPFPDASILTHYVDGVLPVVELERTSVAQLKRMMNKLKDVNILGTVLNKNKG